MATGSTRYRPDWSSGGITAPSVGDVLLDYADRMAKQQNTVLDRAMKEQQVAEEQRRWDIANARAQRKEDRELAEQTAKDVANDILSKGVQARGGILNTQNVIDRLSPSDLTAEEIAFSNANKITTADQARALGKEDLANKLDVQTRFSSDVDAMYNRGMLNETRPQMYERAMSELVSRGLHAPDKLYERLDAARLYEEKAREDKIKDLETKETEITKRQREDAWKTIGAMPGTTSVDAEGNVVDSKGIKSANKDISKGILTIQEAVNEAGFSPEKKAAAITMADLLVKKLEAMDIPANVAAEFVTNEMRKKEGNPFLSYIGISNPVPNFDTTTIDTLASTLAGRIRNEGTGSVQQKEPSRFDLALRYADSSRVSDASELAKIRAQKEALMMTPEERTLSKIDAYLKESSLPDYDTLRSNFGNMELKGSGLSGMDNYLNKLGVVESQNNYNAVNSTSKATGKYQMVGNTAEEYMRKLGYGGTKEELVEKFKSSPELQEKTIRAYTLDNAKTLSDKGIPVNDWSLWVSHNLGIGNAVKVFSGNIDNNVIDAVKRNLPKGVAPTMENYQKIYYNKMNVGSTGTETPNSFFGRDIKTGAKLTTAEEMLKKDEADINELRNLQSKTPTNTIKDLFEGTTNNSSVKGLNADGKVDMTQIGGTIDMSKLLEPVKQEAKVRPGWEVIADTLKSGLNETYKQGKGIATDIFGPALNSDSKVGTAVLATLNNSAAGMLEIARSPYTATKMFTDWLVTGKTENSIFQKNAEQARSTAVKALSEAGVTNPTDQQIAMLVSDVIMPMKGVSTIVKGAKSEVPALIDRLSRYLGDDLDNIRGTGFTMDRQGILQGTSKEAIMQAKNTELQQEVASLVSGYLNPDKIRRLYDIAAANPAFNKPIRDFLSTKGF